MIIKSRKRDKNQLREEDFLALVEKNQDKMYRIAYSYVRNKEDALDVVQEAVYKGYISYSKLKQVAYAETWLIRIVINVAKDILRLNKRIVPLEMEQLNIQGSSESNIVYEQIAVHQALDKLNEHERSVIILRYFEDMKLLDVAKLLEKPISTIKSTLYRALKKMEIELTEED